MKNSPSVESSGNSEEAVLISGRFKMPPGMLFGTMLMLYGRWWIVGSVLPFVAGLAVWGITEDLRWLIVSMMFLFIVFPMIAALLYFSNGLRRECFLNAVEHDVAIAADGLDITLYRKVIEEAQADDEWPNELMAEEENDPEEVKLEKSYSFRIPYSELRPFHIAPSAVIIPVGKGFVWLPLSAFADSEEMKDFMQRIAEGIASNRP